MMMNTALQTQAPFFPPTYRPLPAALLEPTPYGAPQGESLTLSPAALQQMQDDRQNPVSTVAGPISQGVDVVDNAAFGSNRVVDAARTAAQGADEAAAVGKGISGLAKAGKFLGPIGYGLTAITTGAEVVGAARDKSLTKEEKAEKIGGAVGGGVGSIGGGLGGAAAGAAAGAVAGPPGILIGAIIGGVGGGLGGDKIGGFIGEKLGKLFG